MPEIEEQLVIGADGSLTGYGGGLGHKRAMLELEHALPPEDAAGLEPDGGQMTLI